MFLVIILRNAGSDKGVRTRACPGAGRGDPAGPNTAAGSLRGTEPFWVRWEHVRGGERAECGAGRAALWGNLLHREQRGAQLSRRRAPGVPRAQAGGRAVRLAETARGGRGGDRPLGKRGWDPGAHRGGGRGGARSSAGQEAERVAEALL